MEVIIGSAISAVVAIIACIVNNNVQHVREQAAIEKKIDDINANYDKQTALITQQIRSLTDHVNKHNDLIDRMYKVEALTAHLNTMLEELKDDIT